MFNVNANGRWTHGVRTVNASRMTQNGRRMDEIIEYKMHMSIHDWYTWIYHIVTTLHEELLSESTVELVVQL